MISLPLVREDEPQTADAIVVIGGDHKPERLQRAAELYHAGYAPVIVLSAGTLVQEGESQVAEAEVMHQQALALSLPDNVLWLEDQSQSTFQNAYCVKQIGLDHGFRSILLVTSLYHSRRAGHIFQEILSAEITLSVQPASIHTCTMCWWFQPDQMGVVFYEYYNWGRAYQTKPRSVYHQVSYPTLADVTLALG